MTHQDRVGRVHDDHVLEPDDRDEPTVTKDDAPRGVDGHEMAR